MIEIFHFNARNLGRLGGFTMTGGSTQKMNDVWFSVDTARKANLNTAVVSAEMAVLPEVAGMGNLKVCAKPLTTAHGGDWHALQTWAMRAHIH